jgi:hypothetical protein
MGVELRVELGEDPRLVLENFKRRFLYCRVRWVPPGEDVLDPRRPPGRPQPYDIYVDPIQFPWSVASGLFRRRGLVGAKHEVPLFLVGDHPSHEEVLPLTPGPLAEASRLEIMCVTPSATSPLDSFVLTTPAWEAGSRLAWFATMLDLYLTLSPAIGRVAPHLGSTAWVHRLLEVVELDTILAECAFALQGSFSTGSIVPVATAAAKVIEEFLAKKSVQSALLAQLGPKVGGAVVGQLPLLRAWGSIMTFCNTVQVFADLCSPAYASFAVEIPRRRGVSLRVPSLLVVGAGERAICPIEISLPDGRVFAADDVPLASGTVLPGLPAPTEGPDHFTAEVSCLAPDEQAYEFSRIVDVTRASQGGAEPFPVTLTVAAGPGVGAAVAPAVALRPAAVSEQLTPAAPGPVRCDFPAGLGRFVRGMAEGHTDVDVRVAVDLAQAPDVPHVRQATARVHVHVVPAGWRPVWSPVPDAVTGTRLDLPLRVEHTVGSFDLQSAFSAHVTFAADRSWMGLSDIVPAGGLPPDSLYRCYPYTLRLTLSGGQPGAPLLAFSPPGSLLARASLGPVDLPTGLRGLVGVFHAGTAEVVARLTPTPVGDGAPAEAIEMGATVAITTGKASLVVTPSSITLEDDLETEVVARVKLPGGDQFATNTELQAEVSVTPQRLEVTDIVYAPLAEDPPVSPVDLAFDVVEGSSVRFVSDKLTGALTQGWARMGAITRFVGANAAGQSRIRVSTTVRPDAAYDVEPAPPQTVSVTVAQPARAAFRTYTVAGEGTYSIPNTGRIVLWRAPVCELNGDIDYGSPGTEVRLYLDGVRIPDTATPQGGGPRVLVSTYQSSQIGAPWKFRATLSGLPAGEHRLRVEAEKATNLGVPGAAELTLVGALPEISLAGAHLPSETGLKRHLVSVTGRYALSASYRLQLGDGSVVVKDLAPGGLAGSFSHDDYVYLSEGTNVLQLTAHNAFGDTNPAPITATGGPPVLEIHSVGGHAVQGAAVEIATQRAEVKGAVRRCDVSPATLSARPPGGDFGQSSTIPNGPFALQKDFTAEGDHTLRLAASNDFGSPTTEVTVRLLPLRWEWSFYVNCWVLDVTKQKVQAQVINTGSGSVTNQTTQVFNWQSPTYTYTLTEAQLAAECDQDGPLYTPTGVLPGFAFTPWVYNQQYGWVSGQMAGTQTVRVRVTGSVVARRGSQQVGPRYEVVLFAKPQDVVQVTTYGTMKSYLGWLTCFVEAQVKCGSVSGMAVPVYFVTRGAPQS